MECTLIDWANARANLLLEDGATTAFIRGFLDHVRDVPENVALFIGEPFGADDYHSGRQLASYEVGPIGEEIAA